jgi:hypothetical protein
MVDLVGGHLVHGRVAVAMHPEFMACRRHRGQLRRVAADRLPEHEKGGASLVALENLKDFCIQKVRAVIECKAYGRPRGGGNPKLRAGHQAPG